MKSLLLLLRYAGLLGSGLVLLAGQVPVIQRKLDAKRLIPDQYRFGDLYNMTFLRAFREDGFYDHNTVPLSDRPRRRAEGVNLYVIGDSFTAHGIDTSLYAAHRVEYLHTGVTPPQYVRLDSTRRNVLVLQIIERSLGERLQNNAYRDQYEKNGFFVEKAEPAAAAVSAPASAPSAAGASSRSFEETWPWLFKTGDNVSQKLEFLLFNFSFFVRVKEAKAALTLNWFERVASGAAISRDHRHLFYVQETDPGIVQSSFAPFSDRSVSEYVANLNWIRAYYLRQGFDAFYFAMVPNKVTVLEPHRATHNRLIERIAAHPALEVPLLNLADTVKAHPTWYHLGDGHWNRDGKRLWLREVNRVLFAQPAPKP